LQAQVLRLVRGGIWFDQEVTLSAVMVDAIEAWLDAREG
jgi:hypothetical protein